MRWVTSDRTLTGKSLKASLLLITSKASFNFAARIKNAQ